MIETAAAILIALLFAAILAATFGRDWWLRRRGRDPWEGSE